MLITFKVMNKTNTITRLKSDADSLGLFQAEYFNRPDVNYSLFNNILYALNQHPIYE